jgi:predicted nucleic acid-binding protein
MIDPSQVGLVFDHHPLTAYASTKDLLAPSLVASILGRQQLIAVSPLVLAEAYRSLNGEAADVLDLLTGGALAAALIVEPFDGDTARLIGREHPTSSGRHTPSDGTQTPPLITLHTAQLAIRYAAGVVTGEPGPLRALLGPDWPLLEV